MIRAGIRRAFHLAIGERRRWERDVEDEIKLHLALRVEQLIERGMPPDDAYREAIRRFGPLTESRARLVDAARHREQHMRRTEYFADLRQDLSFALRTLRRQKGWTVVTMLTLALGIGATTAVFSVASSLIIRAVPYPHGDRVVLVYQQTSAGNSIVAPGAPVIHAWQTGSRSFEQIEGYLPGQSKMNTEADTGSVNTVRIEPTFLTFAGVQPIAGRSFNDEDLATGGHVVLLSEAFWRNRLGGRRDVIGRPINLGGSIVTVVGVVPAELRLPQAAAVRPDLWLPLDLRNGGGVPRGPIPLQVVGRLRPGVAPATAARELDSLFARAAGITGKLPVLAAVIPPAKHLSFYEPVVMLTFAVGLVLLVACANVAHLVMARSIGRRREFAIRTALGAGRGRVLRQLLTESLLLVVGGTTAGVLVGWVGMTLIINLRPPTLPELGAVRLNSTTLGLAALLAAGTAIVFGLIGAAHARRVPTNDALKNTSANASGARRVRARTMLVVSEMAFSATLIVGATMLLRSVINLQNADLGFQPRGLYSLSVSGTTGRYASGSERGLLTRTVMTRLAEKPGVQSVGLEGNPPSIWTFTIANLEIEGEAVLPVGVINRNRVGSSYWQTMGMRVLQGTTFTDTTGVGQQVIVNANYARTQWPDGSAVGRRIRIRVTGAEPWLTIAGVVADALTEGAGAASTTPVLYTPAADSSAFTILIRTTGADPVAPLRAVVQSIDPQLTPTFRSIEAQVSESIVAPRFIMLLLSSFTVLALALAAIGLHGVMSYGVAERTREIGIRVALGATRGRVARMVITGGVAAAVIGSVVGAIAAVWGTNLIRTQLYGIEKLDPLSYVAAFVVLFATAVVACVMPMRRALAVDPMMAIRAD